MKIIFHHYEKETFSIPNKEMQIKTEEMYDERFADDNNLEALWLMAHTLESD